MHTIIDVGRSYACRRQPKKSTNKQWPVTRAVMLAPVAATLLMAAAVAGAVLLVGVAVTGAVLLVAVALSGPVLLVVKQWQEL